MTNAPDSHNLDKITSIHLLEPRAAHACLLTDLAERGTAYAWIYLIDLPFTTQLLGPHLEHSPLYALVDSRQKATAQALATTHRFFHPYQWSTNRTQHAKTFLFPQLNTVWLITHNLTKGAWTMSNNHAVRIHSKRFLRQALEQWQTDAKRTRPIHSNCPRRHNPPLCLRCGTSLRSEFFTNRCRNTEACKRRKMQRSPLSSRCA